MVFMCSSGCVVQDTIEKCYACQHTQLLATLFALQRREVRRSGVSEDGGSSKRGSTGIRGIQSKPAHATCISILVEPVDLSFGSEHWGGPADTLQLTESLCDGHDATNFKLRLIHNTVACSGAIIIKGARKILQIVVEVRQGKTESVDHSSSSDQVSWLILFSFLH